MGNNKSKFNFITIHRGGNNKFPENSLAAVQDTWTYGRTPEVDIQLTSDQILILMHDNSIENSCSNAPPLKIIDYTYKELSSYKLRSGDGFSHPIAKFDDILTQMKIDSNRSVLLDVKNLNAIQLIAEKVNSNKLQKQVNFTCHNLEECDTYKKIMPKCKTFLVSNSLDKINNKTITHPNVDVFFYLPEHGKIDVVIRNPQTSGVADLAKRCAVHKKTFGIVCLELIPRKVLKSLIKCGVRAIGIQNNSDLSS